ncbi:MAG: arginine/agmatine antiporter [Parachlamydiales bacterium]|nr:arginine/agmatine antiporter [Parachlamydiales bacterium]
METEEKKMGVVAMTALVAGNMIGSGIFLLPSTMARLGSLSLLSWFFTGFGALFLAFVFARMSTMIPKTGGPYAYAHAGLGDALGFQTAYCYWINAWIGNAAIAVAGMGYLSVFFPFLTNPLNACIAAIGFVWLFTWINLKGVQTFAVVQVVTTILKLIPILLIGLLGWFYFHADYITASANVTPAPQLGTFDIITQGATLTLWAFIGFESGTVPAGSVKNPTRTIPIATILGMSIAGIAYIASSVAIMGMIPNAALQNSVSPFADAAQVIFGEWGKWIIAFGASVSCLGVLNGWTLIQGQIPMAAADDNLFLKIFGRRNKKGAPSYAMVITAILITACLLLTISPDLVKQFNLLILIATLAALISYLYTPVSELILFMRGTYPYTKRAVFVALVGIVYACWAIYGSGTDVLSYGALLLLSSIPLYLLCPKNRK